MSYLISPYKEELKPAGELDPRNLNRQDLFAEAHMGELYLHMFDLT